MKTVWAARVVVAGISVWGQVASALAGVTLTYCGYIGGDRLDEAHGLATDDSGNAYVAVETLSSEITFPVAVGPDPTYGGSYDVAVTKVRADGAGLVYSGYIGGSRQEADPSIAVHGAGGAYITGLTRSTEAMGFPTWIGPDLSHNGGSADAFVCKVSPDGTALEYCGYLGGSGTDGGRAIAADATGSAYLAGLTTSLEDSFLPVGVGPELMTTHGREDVFVARVLPDGTGLVYAGFFGGVETDLLHDLALGPDGAMHVVGWTLSTEATFPVRSGPVLVHRGGWDAFVGKVRPDASGLDYLGYIGGDGKDEAYGVGVDVSGSAFVTGETGSGEATFPVVVGPDLTYNGGASDAFVAKVRADGSGLAFCGYIGGADGDVGFTLVLDALGGVYVAGGTSSTEATFPVRGGPDLSFNGASDAFLSRIGADGTSLQMSGYLGGSDHDSATAVAIDEAGRIYLGGATSSSAASFPVTVGPDLTYNGERDAFIARLTVEGCIVAPVEIARVVATKALPSREDVAMSWQPDLGANGYNIWYVDEKWDIPDARQSGSPPPLPVTGCAWPNPALSSTCIDIGAVSRDSPTVFFYQVRAFCDSTSEGP